MKLTPPRLQDLRGLSYALGIAVVLSQLSFLHPLFELLTHFMLQYAMMALALLITLAAIKAPKRTIAVPLLTFLFSGAHVWPMLFATPVPFSQTYDDVRVLQYNTYHKLREFSPAIEELKQYGDIDIMVLQEATPQLVRQAKPLFAHYPYRIVKPQNDAYGVLILSKLPIRTQATHPLPNSKNHFTVMQFETAKRHLPFTLIELHATSPVGAVRVERRNREFGLIAEAAQAAKTPRLVLVGDLNVTPYSPFYRQLLRDSGLRNGMEGRQLQGSWPDPLPGLLRIPIDQVLVGPRVDVWNRTIGPSTDSDHRPMITGLRIYEN